MGRKYQMGNHHGTTHPDKQMGRLDWPATPVGKRILKKRANAKRRRRDKEID